MQSLIVIDYLLLETKTIKHECLDVRQEVTPRADLPPNGVGSVIYPQGRPQATGMT
jgi:hypothetical protein